MFFGTPAFAVPSLQALCSVAEVLAVVCQPDKPAGRGRHLTIPAVKSFALELGLPVIQPTSIRTEGWMDWFESLQLDVALIVAYGKLLPKRILDAPRFGCVNVHASLLPKYRGAAPIPWSILKGEHVTGITLMKLDEGTDTGDIITSVSTPIGAEETAGELTQRLALVGADAVRRDLPSYLAGHLPLHPQCHEEATLSPPLRKEQGAIQWESAATSIHQHVRAFNPWPGAYTFLQGRRIKIHAVRPLIPMSPIQEPPGTVILADKSHLIVACGNHGAVEILTIQSDGGKPMQGTAFVRGRGTQTGDIFYS
ncbi:methionyl-tRNA formyltransferase [Pajaroellobacter abortibovis]|uniref:methionyl-tRNA formyltransferase n=1 Tax=Pajaroellobacter abortibovis TaxID=1882918 RepID=UPI0023DD6C5A|nr:methionyl-tRNA formyltransferase [Pajaroellobacter abortibovis]